MIKRINKLNKLLLLALAILIVVGSGIWYYQSHAEGIYEYNPSTDRSFILNEFKENWYWLIPDYMPNYDAAYMLDHRTRPTAKEDEGNLSIKVYRKKNPAGFVVYYMKELFEGWILFLEVSQAYRSQGYARKLLTYAMNDLKKRGATVIRLITRTDNEAGRKLYTKMGFKDIWTDGAYMRFEKYV